MTVVGLMTMAPMGCEADDRQALFKSVGSSPISWSWASARWA